MADRKAPPAAPAPSIRELVEQVQEKERAIESYRRDLERESGWRRTAEQRAATAQDALNHAQETQNGLTARISMAEANRDLATARATTAELESERAHRVISQLERQLRQTAGDLAVYQAREAAAYQLRQS